MAKTKILNIRLNENEYNTLEIFVKKKSITKAQFIAEAIRNIGEVNSSNDFLNEDISTAKTYGFRLNESEAMAFNDCANHLGETRSRLLRKLVREFINHPYPDLLNNEQAMIRVVIRYLAGISRNLNQITAAINAGKLSHRNIDQGYLDEIKKHVDTVKNEFLKYLEITRKRLVINKE